MNAIQEQIIAELKNDDSKVTAMELNDLLGKLTDEQRDEVGDFIKALPVEERMRVLVNMATSVDRYNAEAPVEPADFSVQATLRAVDDDNSKHFEIVVKLKGAEFGPDGQELPFFVADDTVASLIDECINSDENRSRAVELTTTAKDANDVDSLKYVD